MLGNCAKPRSCDKEELMTISSNATFKNKTWAITYEFFPVIAMIAPSCKYYSVSRLNVEFDQKYQDPWLMSRCKFYIKH